LRKAPILAVFPGLDTAQVIVASTFAGKEGQGSVCKQLFLVYHVWTSERKGFNILLFPIPS
jgi:hypothetical protein